MPKQTTQTRASKVIGPVSKCRPQNPCAILLVANREMGLPIYSATPAQTKNPIFKDLIKTQVLVLAENEIGERLAFIKLPMGEVLSVKENDSFSIQSSDLGINTVEVVKISDISMLVRVDRSEMILR